MPYSDIAIRTSQLKVGDVLHYRRGPWVVVTAEKMLDDVCVYLVTLRHRHTSREAQVRCSYDRTWMPFDFDTPVEVTA